MSITGSTRVFFIVGDPVAQVRAPEVYNPLFQRHGIDAVLVPLKVPAAQLPDVVRSMMRLDSVGGLWVTIPHKAPMLGLMDRVSDLATMAGAVNAVRRHADGTIEGALFDGLGFVKGLDHFGIPVPGRRVLVVGAGGGGQAVTSALAQRAPAHLALYNRTAPKAVALAAAVQATTGVPVAVAASSDPAGFDLVVNCTSQGLQPGDALPFDVDRLDAGAAVVDIIMSRQPTPLLQACAARDITAHPGFEMLVWQVPEVLRFFGMSELAQRMQDDMSEVRQLLAPK